MDQNFAQHEVDKVIHDKVAYLMAKCNQIFETARKTNPKVKLNFNWYIKTLPMDEFLRVLSVTFGIVGGFLTKKERKK